MNEGTQVGPGALVEISYTLYDEDGDVLDEASPDQPLAYVHGYGQIVPGLERALEGLGAGTDREVTIESKDGYGEHDPEGVFQIEKAEFPNAAAVQLEDEFVAEGSDGTEMPLRVIEILPDAFVVDANHPLAGLRLRFKVKVESVRAASDEEIAAAEHDLEDHEHDGCCDHDHDHDHAHAASPLVQLSPRKPALS
jgi:FKBP-type peptidyl-prolyl cis-trans isomerase SlyD